MQKLLVSLVAFGAVVIAVEVQNVVATEQQDAPVVAKQNQDVKAVDYDYIVLDRPVKFVGFTRAARQAVDGFDQLVLGGDHPVLVVTKAVRLVGLQRSLGKDSVIFLGDTIESGMLKSVDGTTQLVDSAGNVTNLLSGQSVIVVPESPDGEDPAAFAALTCSACVTLAVGACDHGVAGVNCGTNESSCSFSCHPAPKPVTPTPTG